MVAKDAQTNAHLFVPVRVSQVVAQRQAKPSFPQCDCLAILPSAEFFRKIFALQMIDDVIGKD